MTRHGTHLLPRQRCPTRTIVGYGSTESPKTTAWADTAQEAAPVSVDDDSLPVVLMGGTGIPASNRLSTPDEY